MTKDDLRDALRSVVGPGAPDGLVAAEAVEWTAVNDGAASVRLHVPACREEADYRALSDRAARAVVDKAKRLGASLSSLVIDFVDKAGEVQFTAKAGVSEEPPAAEAGHRPIGGLSGSASGAKKPSPQDSSSGLPGVKHAIAVGAGKGGVGKSSISAHLAIGLARAGHSVGLLDGDIYGPSMPTMLGLDGMEQVVHEGSLEPYLVHGVKAITLGKLVDPEKPLIWRGPMAHGAFKQLTEQTNWGELDYLIIDLPPGTGDVPLTMAQTLKLTGAVVVCTPQKVAQDDAVRAVRMFQQLGVEVLGVVENMSYFLADDIDPPREYDLFGRGGAEMMAQRLGTPFLGAVPLTPALREHCDTGDPSASFAEDNALKGALDTLVKNLESQVSLASLRTGSVRPSLTIS